jgi:hypothetical protein
MWYLYTRNGKKKKNVDLTSWAKTFLHGMAWIAIHYDKKKSLVVE